MDRLYNTASDNDNLVSILLDKEIISSERVIAAFEAVDRKLFVSDALEPQAYDDIPIRNGNIHLSAPHIYGTVIEAFEIIEGMSFMNIGSGSGYLSALVGTLLGKNGINHGLELQPNVVEHAKVSWQKFIQSKKPKIEQVSTDSSIKENNQENYNDDVNRPLELGNAEFQVGDAYLIDVKNHRKYDRIYIGAGVSVHLLTKLRQLLKPLGILVVSLNDLSHHILHEKATIPFTTFSTRKRPFLLATHHCNNFWDDCGPVNDKLVKIRYLGGDTYRQSNLSNVSFAQLVHLDTDTEKGLVCYFKHQVWDQKTHSTFPPLFQCIVFMLLLGQRRPESKLSMLASPLIFHMIRFLNYEWFLAPINYEERVRMILDVDSYDRKILEERAEKAENDRRTLRLYVWRQQQQIQRLQNRLRDIEGHSAEDTTTTEHIPRHFLERDNDDHVLYLWEGPREF